MWKYHKWFNLWMQLTLRHAKERQRTKQNIKNNLNYGCAKNQEKISRRPINRSLEKENAAKIERLIKENKLNR